ncbi:MAG: hypothetical protein LAO03_18125 [Acidobacteriia bacterium]|nr:hypothetical protein [Terriglobia bacterium]
MMAQELDPKLYNGVLDAFHAHGIKPLDATIGTVVETLATKYGVTASISDLGHLELTQNGSPAVLSTVLEAYRKKHGEQFVADPRRDDVVSRQDLERGTPQEIVQAKAKFIGMHSVEAFENLPKTRDEAQRKAAVPSMDMTKDEYLSLSLKDRSRLVGKIGPEAIGKIMQRRG